MGGDPTTSLSLHSEIPPRLSKLQALEIFGCVGLSSVGLKLSCIALKLWIHIDPGLSVLLGPTGTPYGPGSE